MKRYTYKDIIYIYERLIPIKDTLTNTWKNYVLYYEENDSRQKYSREEMDFLNKFVQLTNVEKIKCIECGAFKGHNPTCSLIDFESAKAELKMYYDSYVKNNELLEFKKSNLDSLMSKKINRLKNEINMWKGKFFTIKNENNQLRKKLNKV